MVKLNLNITLEQDIVEKLKEKTDNRSAYIEMVLRQYLNSTIERYYCKNCQAEYSSSFKPEKCLLCSSPNIEIIK